MAPLSGSRLAQSSGPTDPEASVGHLPSASGVGLPGGSFGTGTGELSERLTATDAVVGGISGVASNSGKDMDRAVASSFKRERPDGDEPGERDDPSTAPDSKRIKTTPEGSGMLAVQMLLMEAVESLSIVSRSLEKWPVFAPSIGISEEQRRQEQEMHAVAVEKNKSKIADHIRRFVRKSRKLIETVSRSRAFDNVDLPVDLINHVDGFMSLNTWLRALYEDVNYENACAKGELYALGSLHSTFKVYVDLLGRLGSQIKPADFTSAVLPPTAKRPPIDRNDDTVEILQVLALLQKPVLPVDLGGDLRIRPESDSTDDPEGT